MTIPASDIARAEALARRRASLFPLMGLAMIIASALLTGLDPAGWVGHAAWLVLFAIGFSLVALGGLWKWAPWALAEDEGTRANRSSAIMTGYYAGIACGTGLYIVTIFQPLEAPQVLRILLVTAIAAPLINFGALERRDLGKG